MYIIKVSETENGKYDCYYSAPIATSEKAHEFAQELIDRLRPFEWFVSSAATLFKEHEEFSTFNLVHKPTGATCKVAIFMSK